MLVKLQVVVIEDNPADAWLVSESLSPENLFDVDYANRLEQGVARILEGGVDVVLLDLGLPDAQGLEGLVRLRQLAPQVPVVVMTGSTDPELGRAAVAAGAQDFLVKGRYGAESLIRVLRYAVKRQQLVAELNAANSDLQAMNESMRDFVAVATHDLRSPLTAVSGFSSLLIHAWASLTDEQKRSHVAAIDRNAKRMTGLVDDLLTLSRLESGTTRPRVETVVLGEAIADHLQSRSQSDDAGVSVSCPPDIAVSVARLDLSRILANYVDNAFKYGLPPIEIEVSAAHGMVEIRVRDHGPGVPPEFEPRLFTKFARDDGSARLHEGTGLGLSIVRALAQVNGGQAFYRRDPAGGCFVVRLPAAPAR